HPEILYPECSHFCEMVNSGEHGATLLHIAIQTAIAAQGVSVLVLPGDIADEAVSAPLTRDLATELGTVQPAPGPVGRLPELVVPVCNLLWIIGSAVLDDLDLVLAFSVPVNAHIRLAICGKE